MLRSLGALRWPAFVAAATLGAEAAAADEVLGARGGWTILRTDQACGMSMTYMGRGETGITFVKSTKGWLAVRVINPGIATTEGANYLVTYQLNGRVVDGAESVGAVDGSKRGFLTKFRPDFEQAFIAGHSLRLYLGNQLVADLSLTGTAAAVAAVNQCLAVLRANPAGVQRGAFQLAPIPATPGIGGAGGTTGRPPTPSRSASTWITASDYPPRALREEREGTTSYALTIAPDGKVMNCQVTNSSGHADLDAATCDSVRRRARFNPASDAGGRPTSGRYSNRVRWAIPRQ